MKTTGTFLRGLVMAILFSFSMVHLSICAQTTLPDSLIFSGTKIDIGEKFRTGYFTTLGHFTINSYFKEPNGNEHIAFVDNYKLFYYKSIDDGKNWSKEQIITTHEGDIFNCALTVDTTGKVFIGITVNDYFNYSNPTTVVYGKEFYYDLYCVTNRTGSWVTELINTHPGNYGPRVAGLFVDAGNNVHIVANYYGWNSLGGTAWEWTRNAGSNTWGVRTTIVQFSDITIDRVIYDGYTIVPDKQGKVTLVMCRNSSTTNTQKPRLFYVRHDGSSWSAPVTITDSVAVAWNRFDALVDTAGHTYIAFLKNNKLNVPELKIIKDFAPAQTALLNLPSTASTDTLNFIMHCNAEGLFSMYLIANKKINPYAKVTFSHDAIHWTDPVTIPEDLRRFMGGVIVKTDTRRGYFADYCKQILATAGPGTALPYGPDTLFYGSIKLLETSVGANADLFPSGIILKQNYPNPFTETTTISWQLPKDAHVVLKVFDFTSREVNTLVDERQVKGEHHVTFNADGLPAGICFYQLQANGRVETKKMVLIK